MRQRWLLMAMVGAGVGTLSWWAALEPLIGALVRATRNQQWAEARLLGDRLATLGPFAVVAGAIAATMVIMLISSLLIRGLSRGVSEALRALPNSSAPNSQLEGLGADARVALDRAQSLWLEERRSGAGLAESLARTRAGLDELQSSLVASDRLATVGKLAAGVAHEVGNPLSGLLGYLSILEGLVHDQPEARDLVQRADAEVGRIDGVVRSLLELGRPARGTADACDVCPIIASTVRLLSSGSDWSGIQVHVETPPTLVVECEAGPLAQVLVNLLLNAAQAMGGQGTITVRATVEEGAGCIAILDDGPGLSAEVEARLFELFFTTKPAGKGTGLGLAVSRHLLRQVGGDLEAANRSPRGARFTIRLPRPRGEPALPI